MTLQWRDQRWHTRFYLWAEPVVAQFKGIYSRTESEEKVHTNLCPYMRTLLVWLPLAFLTNILTVIAVVATATYIPGRLFGWSSYFRTVVVFVVIVGLAKLFFWVIRAFSGWLLRRRNAREIRIRSLNEKFDGIMQSKQQKDPTPGFWAVLGDYLSRGHDFVCPGITIARTRSEGAR